MCILCVTETIEISLKHAPRYPSSDRSRRDILQASHTRPWRESAATFLPPLVQSQGVTSPGGKIATRGSCVGLWKHNLTSVGSEGGFILTRNLQTDTCRTATGRASQTRFAHISFFVPRFKSVRWVCWWLYTWLLFGLHFGIGGLSAHAFQHVLEEHSWSFNTFSKDPDVGFGSEHSGLHYIRFESGLVYRGGGGRRRS